MKKIIGIIIFIGLIVILKNFISLVLMYVIDFMGNIFNFTTVNIIDF